MDYRVTQCPSCGTAFKVTDTQLAMAAGAVRCGSCLQIFRAAEHWVDPPPPAVSAAAEPLLTDTALAAPPSWASLQRQEDGPAAARHEPPHTNEYGETRESTELADAPAAIDELDLTDDNDDWLDEPIWGNASEPLPGDLRLAHDSPQPHPEPEFVPADDSATAAAPEAPRPPPSQQEPDPLPPTGEPALPGQPAADAYTDPANSDGWASPVAQLTRQRWDPAAQQIEDPFTDTRSTPTADEVLAQRRPIATANPSGPPARQEQSAPGQGLYDGFVLDTPLSARRDDTLPPPDDATGPAWVVPDSTADTPVSANPTASVDPAEAADALEADADEARIADDALPATNWDDAELTFADDPALDAPEGERKGAAAEPTLNASSGAGLANAEAGARDNHDAQPEVDESWAEQLLEEAIAPATPAPAVPFAEPSVEFPMEPPMEAFAASPVPVARQLPEPPHAAPAIADAAAPAAPESSPSDTLHAAPFWPSTTAASHPDAATAEAPPPATPEAGPHDAPDPAPVAETPSTPAPPGATATETIGTEAGAADEAATADTTATAALHAAESLPAPATTSASDEKSTARDADIEPVRAEDDHRLEAIVAGTAPVPTSGQRQDAFARTPLGDFEPEPIELQRLARRQRWPQIVWGTIAIAALLGLAAQYIHANIGTLGRSEYRPLVAQFCALTGCRLPALHNARLIETENLVVRSHPEAPSALAVDAVLINRAAFAQPYPDLLLQFSDLNGDAVAGRRFAPVDYLDGEVSGARLMPARQPVRIVLEIADPGARAVNYQLQVVPFQGDPG